MNRHEVAIVGMPAAGRNRRATRYSSPSLIAMAVAVVIVACQRTVEKPGAPTIANTIVGMEFDDGADPRSITLTGYFTTADGATYSAVSSKPSVATATVSGAVLTVTPKAEGSTNVTVTATDENGKVSQTFPVKVKGPVPIENKPPTVRTIPDKTLMVDTTETLALSRYAEDPDGATLMYAAESSNEAVAEVSVANGALTIAAEAVGTATITVTVSDGTHSVAREFDVTVTDKELPPNNPPTIGTIIDRTLEVGDTRDISLSIYANDPEGDVLTYAATSGNPAAATVSVVNDVLTIAAVAEGTATITVTVSDGTNSPVAREFNVTVNPDTPENERPEQELIDDIDDMRRGGTRELDLSSYYDDPDGDPLTYEATSSDEMVVTVSVSGSMLTITGVGVGTARISVTVSDGTDEVRQTFTVTVGSQPPMVDTDLPTSFPLGLAGATKVVNLAKYYDDPEGDSLTYEATSSDTAFATASVSGDVLTITAVAAGMATITVTAEDSDNEPVSLEFFVTVSRGDVVNEPPVVRASMVEDKDLQVGGTTELDLSMYFVDPDEDDTLTYAAKSSNPAAATVSVSGDVLTITAGSVGEADITITATDGEGESATATFMVTVTPPNMVPVAIGIPDQSLEMDFHTMKTLDLSMYFSDSDGPNDLTYTASSSMDTYATAMVDGSTLMIKAVAAGMAPITVTASDGEDSVEDMFTVTVSNPAVPPATSELPDQDFAHGDMEARMFTLSEHFRRATDYAVSVSGDGVVMAEEEGGVLTLTPVGAGNAVVTVTPSNSGGIGSSQSINVTVAEPEELMLPPRPVGTVAAQVVKIEATGMVDVSGNFIEPEGEQLTYAAASSDEGVATATVSEAGVVSIIGVAAGPATITVTVTDTDELTAAQTIQVTVPDEEILPPRYVGSLPGSVALKPGQQYVISGTDIESSFVEDEDESLTFSFSEDDPSSIVQVGQADDGTVTITALAAVGDATVTIIATDTDEEMATHEIAVAVRTSLQPTASGTPDPVALDVGGDAKPVDVSKYFSDPGVGAVTYAAVSDAPGVVTVDAVGGMVTITPKGAGSAMVTVTATNSYGTASQMIEVTVTATPPVAKGTIDPVTLMVGGARSVGLAPYFTPGAAGDTLTYTRSVAGNAGNAVSARVISDILLIEALSAGSATITVTATDADGETAMQTIMVTVQEEEVVELPPENMAPELIPDKPIGPYKRLSTSPAETIMLRNHFRDDGSDALLTYVVTQDKKKETQATAPAAGTAHNVIQVGGGTTPTDCTSIVADASEDDLPDGKSLDDDTLWICFISAGTAEIEIVAIDGLGKRSEPVIVRITVGSGNNQPASGTSDISDQISAANTEDPKLIIDEAREVVKNGKFSDYFSDTDLDSVTADDMLTFEIKYFADGGLDDEEVDEAAIDGATALVEGNAGYGAVEATIDPTTWDGNTNATFTLSVTGQKGITANQAVAIIATDQYGAKVARVFDVLVNHNPMAHGAQNAEADRKTLDDEDDYKNMQWDGDDRADANAPTSATTGVTTIVLVQDGSTIAGEEDSGGYFSDGDGVANLITGDNAGCSVVEKTGDSLRFNIVEDGTTEINLFVIPKKLGPMSLTIECEDTFGKTARDKLDLNVRRQQGNSLQ